MSGVIEAEGFVIHAVFCPSRIICFLTILPFDPGRDGTGGTVSDFFGSNSEVSDIDRRFPAGPIRPTDGAKSAAGSVFERNTVGGDEIGEKDEVFCASRWGSETEVVAALSAGRVSIGFSTSPSSSSTSGRGILLGLAGKTDAAAFDMSSIDGRGSGS